MEILSKEQEEIIDNVLYGTASLSIIGAFFIVMTFLLFKETRTYGTKLIFFLSISDLITSIGFLPWNKNYFLCILQASTLQFFEMSSYLWSLAISISLFQVFYLEKEGESKMLVIVVHLITLILGSVSVAVCILLGRFGKAGSWCWITEPSDPIRLIVYGVVIAIIIWMCLSFVAIRLKLGSIRSEFHQNLKTRLSLYAGAFIVSQIPAVVNRIQNYIQPDNPIFILFLVQAIFQPSQGFFNALVYGFYEHLFIEKYKSLLKSFHCSCCRKMRNVSREDIPIFTYEHSSEED